MVAFLDIEIIKIYSYRRNDKLVFLKLASIEDECLWGVAFSINYPG